MNKVFIHHLETLVPEHRYSQAFLAERLAAQTEDPRAARMVRQVFRKSGIEFRHSVLPDLLPGKAPRLFFPGPGGRLIEPSTEARNRCFIESADAICVELARRAIANAGQFLPADITHVITVSCTGFYNPGPDCRIITELGLSRSTQRYNLGFMGCYAAFPALRMARQFCQAEPAAVVLVLCLELCSLHLQLRCHPDAILGNALFADGAAAAIVSARAPAAERPAFELRHFASTLVPEGRGAMAWEIGDSGFNLALSSYVPRVIGANIGGIIGELLAHAGARPEDPGLWAIHPGGRAILDAIERALALRPDQLHTSREILRRYGNLSSATILFILRELLETRGTDGGTVCGMAFGPGLIIETGLFELAPAAPAFHRRPPTTAPRLEPLPA